MTEHATLVGIEQDRLEDAARGLVEQLVAAVQEMELKRPGTAFTSWEAGVGRERGRGHSLDLGEAVPDSVKA